MFGLLQKIFGTSNDRAIKKMQPLVDEINSLEEKLSSKSDEELSALTGIFKERLSKGETLDDILVEAFALVRETAKRKLFMRHFDVQLMGGMVLHKGKIAEMKTGEGKTLMATLPLYLNALSGKGAHLVTVNDYLSKRDARWMAPVYHFLGMSVGIVQSEISYMYDPSVTIDDEEIFHLREVTRKEAYAADITYGTNNEFGFDYLRDNMKFTLEEYSQRSHSFAIVDEVDSILIDEARTPLIISGPTESSTEKYYEIDKIIPSLKKETHFTVEEKNKQIFLTDDGVTKVESLLNLENLYDPVNLETLHHVNQALKAHNLFALDVDYVVRENEVIIVDEFTGRLMSGRRWSDGLHQAVEAKEKVTIENENQTLASITFQNYFRMYDKLSGMTGTADTEAQEFGEIYSLEVVAIPTNKPMIRNDRHDLIYKSKNGKFNAVIKAIQEFNESGRPILVGTISIDDSEKLGVLLKKHNIKHNVLNAKQHQKEAEIVSQAGRIGSVTLSTNMAGRGTDIMLGGNPAFMAMTEAGSDTTTDAYKKAFEKYKAQCDEEKQKVLEMGGLYIIGTERHESRRIDNQLRGRSGRQGDPGTSLFFISVEDDLMRIFQGERIKMLMEKFGLEEDEHIENKIITRSIQNAQQKVEAHNFDMRKNVLEFDDVMNQQRTVVYDYRRQILNEDGLRAMIQDFTKESLEDTVDMHIDPKSGKKDWDMEAFNENLHTNFGFNVEEEEELNGVGDSKELKEYVYEKAMDIYDEKANEVEEEAFKELEKYLMLRTLDGLWKDHLLSMDHMKSGIGLRGYAQKNPLSEYKKEGFTMFTEMIERMKSEVSSLVFRVQISKEEDVSAFAPKEEDQQMIFGRGEEGGGAKKQETIINKDKVGRNDPCPCGSGKKFKKCHGK